MWFTRISLQNPVFATMMMCAIVVLGLFSYQRLQVDQFPNVDFPVVVVTTEYPGASPEVIESEVSKKIEEGVNAIAGINTLTSRSYEGASVVVLEFQLHIEGRKAAEDVREKIANLRPLLRDEVKDPRVLRFDPASKAVYSLAVVAQAPTPGVSAMSPVELTNWADQTLKKRLENVRGVGSVSLVGGTKREINLLLNPQAMEALGVSADQVVNAVRSENQSLPLGTVRSAQQERVVQIDARLRRPEDFGAVIVARKASGPVYLRQVAQVQDAGQEVESLALYNGQRTLLMSVQKAQDENTIGVVDGLNQAVKEMAATLPPGVRLEPVSDGARSIRVAVNNVRQTLIEGALLTVLIVFLFLNSWRSTVITGLTLPIAIIGTFLFMYMFGFTLNMITLMALSLCVGLLIDDAIVVRENIVRHVQMGKSPYQAALDGTQEIGLAVLATTFSIVAVFLPIGFMGGIIGKFFHEFGITIVAAVMISMFVSFTLDPMLSSIWHDPSIAKHGNKQGKSWYDRSIGRVTGWFDQGTHALADVYQRTLAWALRFKKTTMALALTVFLTSLGLVPLLGTEFAPKADFSEITVSFYTPMGSSLEATEAKTLQVEAILREFPEVKYTLSTINTGMAAGKVYANILVRLLDRKQRKRGLDEMTAALRERLSRVAGITVTHVGLQEAVGGGNKSIEFSLLGPEQAELERISRGVMQKLQTVPGLVDIDSSTKPNKPTIEVVVRKDAASDLGLSVATLGTQLRTLIAGTTVGNWRAPDDQTYDVIVRLAPTHRNTPEDLERLPFALPNAADGSPRNARLNQVAQVVSATGPNQINRRDLSREVSFSGNAHQRSSGEVSKDIRRVMADVPLPPGYRFRIGGSTKSMEESFSYALSSLALAVIFIYMILASQFKSFLQPLALMSSLPLTLIGVVLSLMFFRSTLSMFSAIGFVMLMGLVTKNAILLVDFAIRAREPHLGDNGQMQAGLGRTEALLLAARVRLRPIMMTTLAMIFGMVPLAFALSEGSEQRAPMGQAVIGGVITSSLLTLVVVPVIYCYMDDLARWARRAWGSPPSASGTGHGDA